MKKRIIFLFLVGCLVCHSVRANSKRTRPSLVVVFVIDQFAYSYLHKLRPYFSDGIKFLLDNGVCYENAYFPHGSPSTAPGHATLSAGTIPKDHGVVLNSWFKNGEKVLFVQDLSSRSAVFSPDGPEKKDEGRSCHHMQVDTVSDSLIRSSKPSAQNQVYALSHKPRAAIAMAGQLGKAIWFDDDQSGFVSSKAYFETLPAWVKNFNKRKHYFKNSKIFWDLRYPKDHDAYNFFDIHNKEFAAIRTNWAGKEIVLRGEDKTLGLFGDKNSGCCEDNDSDVFLKFPQSNQLLLDLADQCLDDNFSRKSDGAFLLWVSLSSLDMIGHKFGPNSLEVIDMIYHLDRQIGDFMKQCRKRVSGKKILFVLTADHGVTPIPELVGQKGLSIATRLVSKTLIQDMNKRVTDKFGVGNMVVAFKTGQFFLNKKLMKKIPIEKSKKIIQDLKNFLLSQRGIKNVWTKDELRNSNIQKEYFGDLFKKQVHPTRSGDLICMLQPFSAIFKRKSGATHRSPYDRDTHVPLVLYQEGALQRKRVIEKVWVPQFTVTLSKILGICKPSAARYEKLPGM